MVIEGVPLLLCNEQGISFVVQSLGSVVKVSLGFAPMGSRTTVGVVVQVPSPAAIPAVVTVKLEGDSNALRL